MDLKLPPGGKLIGIEVIEGLDAVPAAPDGATLRPGAHEPHRGCVATRAGIDCIAFTHRIAISIPVTLAISFAHAGRTSGRATRRGSSAGRDARDLQVHVQRLGGDAFGRIQCLHRRRCSGRWRRTGRRRRDGHGVGGGI